MRPKPVFDAVLFDIDNVLIDTRRSYLEAIRWTVEIYLTSGSVPMFPPPGKSSSPQLLSLKDVDQFKLLGGFNDDWDCCYGLLVYLLNLPVEQRSLSGLKKKVRIPDFVNSVKKRPLGVKGITKRLGRPPGLTIEKISGIFQAVYLGNTFGKPSPFWNRRGLIYKEKPIFRRSSLRKLLHLGARLGIATGRPRFEAEFALKRFGILEFFDAITTIDEVKKAEREHKQSLRKPHPYSVLETAKKMGPQKNFIYVGDLPDDILAARQAKKFIRIQSVAFPFFSSDPKAALEAALKARPDFLLRKATDLSRVVLRGKI